MPTTPSPVTLADALRAAVRESGLSYSRLAQLAKLDSGTISHFMVGDRDMTLGVASRLCAALGYGLTKVGETVTEPLAAPPPTNRARKNRRPATAFSRGRGRRVDLESKQRDAGEASERKGVEGNPPTARTNTRLPEKEPAVNHRRQRGKGKT